MAPLRFLSAGAWSARKDQHAPPHRHAGWKITYYRTGRIDSIVDGVRYEATPGTVLVLRPNAVHAERALTQYSNYYLLVDAPDDQPWPASCHADATHDIGWLLAAVVRETSSADRYSAAGIASLLRLIDVTLRRHHPGERPDPTEAVVRAVEQLFEENYSQRISIAAVAAQIGLSGSSLRHYFASSRGVSPQFVLQQVRVRHALTLLRTSDLPQAAIAARCGFHSASHLSRQIKAVTGAPPGSLR